MKHPFRLTVLCAATALALIGCAPSGGDRQATGALPGAAAQKPSATVLRKEIAQGVYELVYSEKQNLLFVASAGNASDPSVPYQVLVVKPDDLSVVQTIKLPLRAFSLALDDAGDRLYVGHTGQGSVTVIDTRTLEIRDTYTLARMNKRPNGRESPEYHFRQMVLDTRNQRLYMPGFNDSESKLFVVNTSTGQIEKILPGFGFTATGIALDARRDRLYVSNMQGEAIVVDTRANEIVKRFDMRAEQPLNLAYDEATDRLLAVDQGHPKMREFQKRGIPNYTSSHDGNRVVVIDLATEKQVAEMPATGPINLRIDAPRQRLYVTNRLSGEVTVFDSKTYEKLQAVSLPAHPNTLAVNRQTGDVYVSVKNGEDQPKGALESVARIRF